MPYSVHQLIEGHAKPLTVSPSDSAQKALELMKEHAYSQLPVVDGSGRSLGMVTSDLILQALEYFGVTIDALKVSNAIDTKVHKFRSEDNLFDLLDDLRDHYAALIVDGDGRLTGIVTNYDTAEYFRRRAEDTMLVEDIETTVKDHILAAFADASGETDQTALASAIDEVTDSRKSTQKRFENALRRYLELSGYGGVELDADWVEQAFSHLDSKRPPKMFDDLTFAEYASLLLHRSRWPDYGRLFGLDSKAVQKLLDEVRQTRNILAHFRGEISPKQRDQLRFCAGWLAQHPPVIPVTQMVYDAARLSEEAHVVKEARAPYAASGSSDTRVVPADEELAPDDSRYAPLALWLQSQPISHDRVTLTFEQIEGIINSTLPASARQHRSWWANDSVGHVQSQQWLEVGWRVSYINMTEGRITFARIKEREKAYIDFYSALLSMLHQRATPFSLKAASPDGHSWITVAWVPEDGLLAGPLSFSFSRNQRFRVELYIDTGEQKRNKQIFDHLDAHKDEIESALGDSLSWERLTDKRASRIALYMAGSITDDQEELAHLRRWAVDSMIAFYTAIKEHLSEAVRSTQVRSVN